MEKVHVIYMGRVQGVGFRFTAERVASRMGISGYVKNLPNGAVEMEAEGDKKNLEEFLEAVNIAMDGYIRDFEVKWSSGNPEFSSFGIKF